MTLLEVTVATAILASVLAMTYATVFNAMATLKRSDFVMDLDRQAMIELRKVEEQLPTGSGFLVDASGSAMGFQIPIDWDLDGDVLDENGDPEYGYYLLGTGSQPGVAPFGAGGTDPLNWSVRHEWVATGQLLSEADDDADYNRDADKADVFLVGRIDKIIYDGPPADVASGAAVEILRYSGPEGIVQRQGAIPGDIDEDGDLDPIFSQVDAGGNPSGTGNRFIINLWVMGRDPDGNATMRDVHLEINLRNLSVPQS